MNPTFCKTLEASVPILVLHLLPQCTFAYDQIETSLVENLFVSTIISDDDEKVRALHGCVINRTTKSLLE